MESTGVANFAKWSFAKKLKCNIFVILLKKKKKIDVKKVSKVKKRKIIKMFVKKKDCHDKTVI